MARIPTAVVLPERAPAPLRAAVGGAAVLAWSDHDLDEALRFADGLVVLTEEAVVLAGPEGARIERIALSEIREAELHEGRGFARLHLDLESGSRAIAYTQRHQATMGALVRRLKRRLPAARGGAGSTALARLDGPEAGDEELRCARCGEALPPLAEGCPRCVRSTHLLLRLLELARPYRRELWLAVALTLTISGLSTLPPYCSLHLIDDGIRAQDLDGVLGWGALAGAAVLTLEVMNGLRARLMATIGIRFSQDLRHIVYAHLQALGLRYYQRRSTGSLLTRVTADTERIWQFVVLYYVNLLRDGAMILFIAIVMFSMSWPLALAALLPLPFLAAVTYFRSVRFQGLFNRAWYARARLNGVIGDALPGVRVVKAFGGESREVARFDRASRDVAERGLEVERRWATLAPVFSLVMRLGSLFIWILGGVWIVTATGTEGELTLGVLTAFSAYLWQFYTPVMGLASSHRVVAQTTASAHRILELLDTSPDITSKPGALRPLRLKGRVELERVAFSYDGVTPVLENVSLSVEPGEMIGICGPSGAGKSTLVHLICRFYDVREGRVLLDGQDVRDYELSWLRRQIGVVLQEPFLFRGTILDNLRYGSPDATERQVMEAARAAEAHDFIVALPDGYDSVIGERGLSLSGGERQRLSIARAIVHDPRILILDEATSSVDVETEARIRAALDRLVKGRTTFAIAHRLSTLRAASRLVVLENGTIAEVGSHEALLSKPEGIYRRMHDTHTELSQLIAVAG